MLGFFFAFENKAEAAWKHDLQRLFRTERDVILIQNFSENEGLVDQNGDTLQNPGIEFYYKCLTVMRLNFWTWDGHFVIVSEQRINPDEEALKAMLTEEAFNSLSGPWRYWFPTGLVCLVLGIIGMVIYKRTRPTFADEAKTILSDPRYKNVVEQMKREQLELEAWVKSDDWKQSENWKSSNGMDFDDIHEEIHSRQNTMITNSVQNLVDVGIDPELAEKNLRKVIEYLSHQEEKETDSIENG